MKRKEERKVERFWRRIYRPARSESKRAFGFAGGGVGLA